MLQISSLGHPKIPGGQNLRFGVTETTDQCLLYQKLYHLATPFFLKSLAWKVFDIHLPFSCGIEFASLSPEVNPTCLGNQSK
jgi:hypothetical protein